MSPIKAAKNFGEQIKSNLLMRRCSKIRSNNKRALGIKQINGFILKSLTN